MKPQALADLLSAPDRVTTLSTADADGMPNAAVIGSVYLAAEDQVWIGLGNNRTWKNLRENPGAALLAVRPGRSLLEWSGARLYLQLAAAETTGPRFDQMLARIEATAGRMAARTIRQLAIFRILEVRPLLDLAGGS